MRLLARLFIAVITCLIAIAPLTVPAIAQEGPSISLSPASEVPGTLAHVYGYNFTADKFVDIYYYLDDTDDTRVAEAETDDEGYFHVTFEVPESYKGTHLVRAVEDSTMGFIAYASFTVEPELTLSPDGGPVDTSLNVIGHGFGEDEENIELRYYTNGDYVVVRDDIPADENGSWQTSFAVPISTKGAHKIDAEGEDTDEHEVEDVIFDIEPLISLGKTSGSPGESIGVTATGFYARDRYIEIIFAGEETKTEPDIIRADDNGYWEASFEVPELPNDDYDVTAEGELTGDANVLSFTIGPGLVLSPDEGHVGTNLTVTGHGFASDEDVDITYDGIPIETADTDDKGSFETTFPVPESSRGDRAVSAEDDTGNNATAYFKMESEAPDTPDPVSPADGVRVGFIGKLTPAFEWSAVSDDSGVYYSLQIASSQNMTATGAFFDFTKKD